MVTWDGNLITENTILLVSCKYLCFDNMKHLHYVKSVHIWGYSDPYFPAFGLNTQRYGVSLRIQSECGKIRTIIIPNTDTSFTRCQAIDSVSPFKIFSAKHFWVSCFYVKSNLCILKFSLLKNFPYLSKRRWIKILKCTFNYYMLLFVLNNAE